MQDQMYIYNIDEIKSVHFVYKILTATHQLNWASPFFPTEITKILHNTKNPCRKNKAGLLLTRLGLCIILPPLDRFYFWSFCLLLFDFLDTQSSMWSHSSTTWSTDKDFRHLTLMVTLTVPISQNNASFTNNVSLSQEFLILSRLFIVQKKKFGLQLPWLLSHSEKCPMLQLFKLQDRFQLFRTNKCWW